MTHSHNTIANTTDNIDQPTAFFVDTSIAHNLSSIHDDIFQDNTSYSSHRLPSAQSSLSLPSLGPTNIFGPVVPVVTNRNYLSPGLNWNEFCHAFVSMMFSMFQFSTTVFCILVSLVMIFYYCCKDFTHVVYVLFWSFYEYIKSSTSPYRTLVLSRSFRDVTLDNISAIFQKILKFFQRIAQELLFKVRNCEIFKVIQASCPRKVAFKYSKVYLPHGAHEVSNSMTNKSLDNSDNIQIR